SSWSAPCPPTPPSWPSGRAHPACAAHQGSPSSSPKHSSWSTDPVAAPSLVSVSKFGSYFITVSDGPRRGLQPEGLSSSTFCDHISDDDGGGHHRRAQPGP